MYDFLRSAGLIDDQSYNSFMLANRVAKVLLIAHDLEEIWGCNFVHSWKKPDSIPQEEFDAEKQLFVKSYEVTDEEISDQLKAAKKELDGLGTFGKAIVQEAMAFDSQVQESSPFLDEWMSEHEKGGADFEELT